MTKRLPVTPGAASEPNRAGPASEHPAVTEHSGLSEFDLAALPTAMRRQLIAGELPVVPAHELFDTSPPNRNLAAPPSKDVRVAVPASPPAHAQSARPATDGAFDEPSIPLRSKRNSLLALLVVAVILAAIAVVLFQVNRPDARAVPSAPTARIPAEARPVPSPANDLPPVQPPPAASTTPAPRRAAAEPNRTEPPRSPAPQPSAAAKGMPAKTRAPRPAASSASSDEQPGSLLHSIVAPANE